ncbi:DUF2225 domain-containing protein [Savagea faecisuis]|uniref:DUF2225 domain-containing protein n=1 Tax=Savagea faecisuis TaxID=1274803 RepID=A0ABW3GUX2_9BACL
MQIEPIYPKSIKCLYCKHPFKTSRVRSRFVRVASHDTDFKPNYKNVEANPLYYNVAVCPSCGFAFTEDFLPYFAPHAEQKIEKIIRANWNERDLTGERTIEDAIETYKLALLSSKLKEEKALPTAGLALRLAWLYRELGDEENEIRFLTASRDAYKEAFTAGDHAGTTMSETRVVYLIAELSWRIGDKDEAIRNFSYIISNQKNSTDPKAVDLAKERWQEIRELDENKSE